MKLISFSDRRLLMQYCFSNLLVKDAFILIEDPKEYALWQDEIERVFPRQEYHSYFRRLLARPRNMPVQTSLWVIKKKSEALPEKQGNLTVFTEMQSRERRLSAIKLG